MPVMLGFYILAFLNYSIFNFKAKVIEIVEYLSAAAEDPQFIERYRKENIVTRKFKYILLWTRGNFYPFYELGIGRQSFKQNNCAFTNCLVYQSRNLFGGDLTEFDAIAFNGVNLRYTKRSDLPQQRSSHQKYIFFNTESSANEPLCNHWADNFFNWTSSYRLDSDIIYSSIFIRDKNGKAIGPRLNMTWVTDMKEISEELKEKLRKKKKAAAWFVSNCFSKSKREVYVKSLQNALKLYNLTVDIYGKCGGLVCKKVQKDICNAMISSDYYFYLSFENSFAEDYVTEKLLTALNNDAVPIVYGGAKYTRFLPNGSYIDARAHTPESLAAILADVIASPHQYHNFFRWRNHYSYSAHPQNLCKLCAALNDRNKMARSVHKQFRRWWNGNKQCEEKSWRDWIWGVLFD